MTTIISIVVTFADGDGDPEPDLPVYAFDGATYTVYHGATGDYRFRADKGGAQYWSGASNHCTATLPANGIRTTQYDAANRLTSVDGMAYTWDARGNLVSDGTFTYAYSSAGRMVRAAGVTVTLVYTYNAAGLRVAQAVDGDVTTFAWDWASRWCCPNEGCPAYDRLETDPIHDVVGYGTYTSRRSVSLCRSCPEGWGYGL